ncbi:MAG: NifU family protein [Deltaproteobacteria bacterium]|nr:NifU family protein [Deltaproteobacteria bacterium]MBW2382035.1 NifU family protein [Deltaproteobacteria bacterium]MBW2696914.1 NifU family protein [Deltaproteobacteria bacterium]
MPEDTEMLQPPPSREDVEAFLDLIRPGLIADNGNLELAGVDSDGTVRIVFQGECAHCPAQLATLRVAIEEPLCRAHPGVVAVLAV